MNSTSPTTTSDKRFIRAIGDARITGYIGIWGSPRQRDCYGTWFDATRPPNLGLVGDKPNVRLMYQHSVDDDIRMDIIGVVTRIWDDATGIGFEADLFRDTPHFERIMREIRSGQLATSSGSADHLAQFDADGRFVRWYLSELSLTDNPCERRMPKVSLIRSQDGTQRAVYAAEDGSNAKDGARPCECAPCQSAASNAKPTSIRGNPMSELSTVTAPDARGLLQDLNLPPDADAVTVLAALVERDGMESVLQMLQSMQAPAPSDPMTSAAPQRENAPSAAEPMRGEQLRAALQALFNPPPAAPKPTRTVNDLAAQLRLLMMSDTTTTDRPTPPAPPQRQGMHIGAVRDMRFDHLSPEALGYAFQMLKARVPEYVRAQMEPTQFVSQAFWRALVLKTAGQLERNDPRFSAIRGDFTFVDGRPIRANEVMGTGQSGYGSEWAEDLPGTVLWETVRNETPVYQALLSRGMDEREIPRGYKSETIPLEGSDPTWYVASEATDIDTNSGQVTPKISSSKTGTGERQLTVAKLSVWQAVTSEAQEDTLVNLAEEALRKIRITSPERIEYILLNADTATGANTNINLIDATPGTAPTKPDYTLLNGFLKLALVTNTANSRAVNVPFSETDFLATIQLLPAAYRMVRDRLVFFVDPDTALAAANMPSVKTKDVFTAATLEQGVVERIWQVQVVQSAFMALANTAGKISNTGGNNIKGRILVVRPDRWTMRWKRRLQVEQVYNPIADTQSIVGHMRFGLAYYDTEAAAVTYNVPVTLS